MKKIFMSLSIHKDISALDHFTALKKTREKDSKQDDLDFKELMASHLAHSSNLEKFFTALTLKAQEDFKPKEQKQTNDPIKDVSSSNDTERDESFVSKQEGKEFVFGPKNLFSFMDTQANLTQNFEKADYGFDQKENHLSSDETLKDLTANPNVEFSAKIKLTQADMAPLTVKIKKEQGSDLKTRDPLFIQTPIQGSEKKESTDLNLFSQVSFDDLSSQQEALFQKEAVDKSYQKSPKLFDESSNSTLKNVQDLLFSKELNTLIQPVSKEVSLKSVENSASQEMEGMEVSSLSLKGSKEQKVQAMLRKDLSEQIAQLKRLASQIGQNKKISEFNLNLQPEAFGAVRVKIEIEQDQVYARFVTQHEEDLKTLANQKTAIQEIFSSHDLNAQGENLSFFMNQEGGGGSKQKEDGQRKSADFELGVQENTNRSSTLTPLSQDGSILV